MDDLLQEFLTETTESMETLDNEIITLEQNPNDPELLSNIFRLVHTIKGTCGFLGLPRLEAVAHSAENVLGKFRDGVLEVTPAAVSLILASLDQIKELLKSLEQTEQEPEGEDTELIARLDAMAEGSDVPEPEQPIAEPEVDDAAGLVDPGSERELKAGEVSLEELERIFNESPGPTAGPAAAEEAAPAEEAPAPSVPAAPVPAPAAKAEEKKTEEAAPKKDSASVASQTIRVNVDLLENLMTMVSELVLTRNQLLQILRTEKDSEFTTPLQRLSHVTSELQEGVMKTRMQPIGNAWAKLPRIVRDLSLDLDKKIDLQMIGAETELDRQVLELIKDPLTHMVRNSADHGIEMPAERVAAGKAETGTVTLNAFHEGGHIIIEISDNGKGLAVEKIKEKVLSNGLVSETDLEAMSDTQIQQFIFKAGFSTAAVVTSVSGRGVGMDVVRTNIEKIGGTIDLKSIEGRGSTFTIKIPLTLAIVSALIIECGGERFAVPQISVVELVRASNNSEHTIEHIQGTPVLRLRDRLLPLVPLRNLMHLDGDGQDAETEETFVVVTQVGSYTFGIIVDRVFDTEEIVVKPVAPVLRNISMFSGNTILGDGSVIMILDPNGIAAETGEITVSDQVGQDGAAAREGIDDDRVTLLVFRAGDDTPKAVPLALIARLEEIDISKVEYTNGKPLVQYRGKLMPLVPVSGEVDFGERQRQPVLVFSDRSRSMGLIVDEIVDIVEDRLSMELSADKPGMLGSAIVAGHATDVIDTGFYLTQAYGDWFGAEDSFGQLSDDKEAKTGRLLLIDDSPFFRNLLMPMLSVAGYTVTACEGANEALAMCDAGREFDVIVSDIEMPDMNGFELAEKIRDGSRWSTVPLVALSGHASAEDFERGRQAGFTDYVAKFDREGLLETLSQTMAGIGTSEL